VKRLFELPSRIREAPLRKEDNAELS